MKSRNKSSMNSYIYAVCIILAYYHIIIILLSYEYDGRVPSKGKYICLSTGDYASSCLNLDTSFKCMENFLSLSTKFVAYLLFALNYT